MILSAQEFNSQFLMMPEQKQQKVADFVLSRQSKLPRRPFKTTTEKPLQTEGERILEILKKTDFLGSLPDSPDLSENYKAYLYSSEPIEEGQVSSIFKFGFLNRFCFVIGFHAFGQLVLPIPNFFCRRAFGEE